VDNGSDDDSVSAIREAFPSVIVLETGTNLGFAGGNNVGIEYALQHGAEFAYLLNNDTVIRDSAITTLVEAAQESSDFGILSPVIHYYDEPDVPWFAGSRLELQRGVAVHDNARVPAIDEPPCEIPWASGCAMLIRADTLRELQGFDERYFLIWEDVDLSLRTRKRGWRIGLVPGARVYHKVSRSFRGLSHRSAYYYLRNNLLLLREHAAEHYRAAAVRVLAARLREVAREFRNLRPGAWRHAQAMAKAVVDHQNLRYGQGRGA
jgi:hypothetical protein